MSRIGSSRPGKTTFVCSGCGAAFPKWAGQCPECRAWNTLTESLTPAAPLRNPRFDGYAGDAGQNRVQVLSDISTEERSSTPT